MIKVWVDILAVIADELLATPIMWRYDDIADPVCIIHHTAKDRPEQTDYGGI